MIASLPMYDWPHLHAAHDRLWAAIRDDLRAKGIAAPDRLSRCVDVWAHWLNPDLVLSQTCGLPYRSKLFGKVTKLATPNYALEGALPGYYYSVIVVRRGDSKELAAHVGRRLAINGYDSQSGWGAPAHHAAARNLRFSDITVSGSHRESARLVATNGADIAAIDAVTWRLVEAQMPHISALLQVIDRTEPTPGLPLITARQSEAPIIAKAVATAIATMEEADRQMTGLVGLTEISDAAYRAVPDVPH
ncbi:MAG: PhnD/SsuA/transferrin family substrate-binding protein [Paracoccaceae bacterium]